MRFRKILSIILIFSVSLPCAISGSAKLEFLASGLWSGIIDIEIYNNYLYCLYRQGIEVLDINDINNIKIVERIYINNNFNSKFKVYKKHLFVKSDKLRLYKIQRNGRLRFKQQLDTSRHLRNFKINDNKLYTIWEGDYRQYYITAYDLKDMDEIKLIDTFDCPEYSDEFCANDYYACFFHHRSVHIYKISDNNKLILSDSISTFHSLKNSVLSNNYLIVCQGRNLIRYDLSDSTKLKSFIIYNSTGYIVNFIIKNNTIYIADKENGLIIVNYKEPEKPKLIAKSKPAISYVQALAADKNKACLTALDGDIYIYDVTNINAPEFAGKYFVFNHFGDIYVIGKYAFTISSNYGLVVIDISNPFMPLLANYLPIPGDYWEINFAIKNNYLYLAHRESGIYIVDIKNPENPMIANNISDGMDYHDIKTAGELAFVTYSIDIEKRLKVYDISEPEKPNYLTEINSPGTLDDFIYKDEKIYIADGDSGLVVYDLKNKKKPELLSSTILNQPVTSLFIKGSNAYLSPGTGIAGCIVYHTFLPLLADITNPRKPIILYDNKASYYAISQINSNSTILDGDRVLIPKANSGIVLLYELQLTDLSDFFEPAILDKLSTQDKINGLYVKNDYIYMSTASTGITILKINGDSKK